MVVDNIAALEALTETESGKNSLNAISNKFQEYSLQFKKIVDLYNSYGLTETDGLHGALRQSVHNVETLLKNYDEAALTISMLSMRRHEKDFMARLDDKYIGRMADEYKNFTSLISQSSIPYSDQKNIEKLMASYQDSFNTLAKMALSIGDETSKLSNLYAEAEPLLEEYAQYMTEKATAIEESTEQASSDLFRQITIMIIAITIATIILSLIIGRKISTPIVTLSSVINRLSQDDLEVEISGQDRKDEIGSIAHALVIFKNNALEVKRLQADQAKDQQRQLDRLKELERLTADFDNQISAVISNFTQATVVLNDNAKSMESISSETNSQATAIAAASEEASANVQTAASAAEELSASITEIRSQIFQSSEKAKMVSGNAENTMAQIQRLAEAADRIGDVVTLIRDIAEQTNLLALNATIESARAGEAGKGFAVVANEVKTLAGETAKATEDISSHILSVQSETKASVEAIRKITEGIQELEHVSTAISSAIEEQTAATSEIARSSQEAATGTQEVNKNVSMIAQATNNTNTIAHSVLKSSDEFSTEIGVLNNNVQSFLTAVKKV